jgi:hypothetical protein
MVNLLHINTLDEWNDPDLSMFRCTDTSEWTDNGMRGALTRGLEVTPFSPRFVKSAAGDF